MAQEEERLRVEEQEALREAEAEEMAWLDDGLARQTAVEAVRLLKCATFAEEAYVSPTTHLFVPSGFDNYVPQQELVLRDPTVHLSTTWMEVYFQCLL